MVLVSFCLEWIVLSSCLRATTTLNFMSVQAIFSPVTVTVEVEGPGPFLVPKQVQQRGRPRFERIKGAGERFKESDLQS